MHRGGSDTVLKPTFLSLCCSVHLSCSRGQTWLTCCGAWCSGPCWGTRSTPGRGGGVGGGEGGEGMEEREERGCEKEGGGEGGEVR